MHDRYTGLLFIAIGVALGVAAVYGLVVGEVHFMGRQWQFYAFSRAAEPAMYWSFVVFYLFAGTTFTAFGRRLVQNRDI